MKNPPILECRDWTDCLMLAGDEAVCPDCSGGLHDARLDVLAAVSLAWYLAETGLAARLPDSRPVRVWVIGAELLDARKGADSMAPLAPLLELPGPVETLFAGPAHDPSLPGCRDLLDACAQRLPLPDVAVCFHPGLELDSGLIGPGLLHLLRAGVPVVFSAYSLDEQERDAWIASRYGLVVAPVRANPWALDPGGTGLRWAEWMWHLDAAPEAGLRQPAREEIEGVRLLAEMVGHSRLNGLWPQPALPGSSFLLPDRAGGQREMLHVFDGFWLDPLRRRLYAVEGGRLVPVDRQVPRALIEAWPRTGEEMERAIWAARVKREVLLSR